MRIQWIDTYRGFLAILVIIGHTLIWCTPIENINSLSMLYIIIYTFHMPAFFYVAGRVRHFQDSNLNCNNLDVLLKLFINKKSLRNVINLSIPTLLSYIVLIATLIIPSILPIRDALVAVNYWFIWVMIVVSTVYPICLIILKKKKVVFFVFFIMTIIASVYSATLSKFLGYFLCYAAGACEQDFKGEDRVGRVLYQFRHWIILAYFIIVAIFYFKFSISIVLNPIYKCVFGLFISHFLAVWFSKSKPIGIFIEAGKTSFLIYLFQISAFYWTTYVIPKDNFLVCSLMAMIVITTSLFVPIWINRRLKNTIIYKIIFSPYQYIEKYLPSAFTSP